EVDRQVRVDDRATVEALGGGARHPRATQRRFHPTAELAHREGLRYVVVGTDLKPGDLVGLGAFRGQHDDRHLAARAQLAADFDPVAAGQHQVEDDQVEAAFVEALQGFGAVQRRGDVIALLAQRVAEQRLYRLLVIDEKNAGGPIRHIRRVIRPGTRTYLVSLEQTGHTSGSLLGHMCDYP